MTCTVALVRDGTVWMGTDSAAVSGGNSMDLLGTDNGKVFRKNAGDKPCLVGFAGSLRFCQLLEHGVELPPLPDASDHAATLRWLIVDVVKAVRLMLKDEGITTTKDGIILAPGSFMIGVGARLYVIDPGMHVKELVDSFGAIGSGRPEANGVLFAIERFNINCEPETAIRAALEAAERWTSSVRGPFHVIQL